MSEAVLVTVTLHEPVAMIREARTDFQQSTYDHIPGAVLRGALAAVWIRQHGKSITETAEFREIFEGEGSFGPLHTQASLPIPISMYQHKYAIGEECRYRWWDRARGEDSERCPQCKEALEGSKGTPVGHVVRTNRTRAALDPSGLAVEGQLFNETTLPPGTRLSGWLSGDAVRALDTGAGPVETLLLGGGRSVRGRASIAVDRDAQPEPVEQDEEVVILRLASPGIFVDQYGFPSSTPDLAEIGRVLGVEVHDVDPPWMRWTEVGGWHAASGLPKPVERAAAPGSTYRLRCAEPASPETLARLRTRGIGLRRREGFGALMPLSDRYDTDLWRDRLRPLRNSERKLGIVVEALHKRTQLLLRGDHTIVPGLRGAANDPAWGGPLRDVLEVTDATFHEELVAILEAMR